VNRPIDIPPGLQASLDAVPSDASAALLLRHSDRWDIADGESGHEVTLTPIGRDRARLLADRMAHLGGVVWVDSSPYLRCLETGELLSDDVRSCTLLGSPGPFVVDREEGGRVWRIEGNERMVRRQMAGHQWPFMRPTHEGVGLLIDHVRARHAERQGIGALISHDAIVMPIISLFTDDRFEDRWLSPLDGLILVMEPLGELYALWQGRRYGVPS